MSASSSIAAAKRRRGGTPAPPTPPSGRQGPAPNVLTPQQRALLLQQQQLMSQKNSNQTAVQIPVQNNTSSTVYNPNITAQVNKSTNFQVVPGPNGLSVPVGPDGKPLHPGVLIMEHEKRISDLEKAVAGGSHQFREFEHNAVNIVVEESEAAPWEQDMGMFNLKLDELNKRLFNVEQVRNQQQLADTNNKLLTDTRHNSEGLQSKVDLLERQLATTKELLLKVQTFAMETNTMLLKYTNMFEQNINTNQDTVSLEVLKEDVETSLKAWVDAGSLALNSNDLDDITTSEVDKASTQDENKEEETDEQLYETQ